MKIKKAIILVLFLLLCVVLNAGSKFIVTLKMAPQEYQISVDNKIIATEVKNKYLKNIYLTSGKHCLTFSAKGYKDKILFLLVTKSIFIEDKLERESLFLEKKKEFKTGIQPKSVEFTPCGKYIVSALLYDRGVDLYSVETLEKIKQIEFPENFAKHKGFVEIAFVERLNEMWISQMTTGFVHIVDLTSFEYKKSINVKGVWSKFIAFDKNEEKAFVSNWVSKNISVIDVNTHNLLKIIPVNGIPRGMCVDGENKYLYICIFSNGDIVKVDLSTYKVVKIIKHNRGAKRHIVYDNKNNLFYISDMARGSVVILSAEDDSLVKEVFVDEKINTIALSETNKYLFISSRGPNNVESYLKKGPVYGKIYIMDIESFELVDWIWGRNQPTGLTVSPNTNYIAFSNFLDKSIEIYKTSFN